MIKLTWKAGSEFLDDKGPSFAIALFAIFMSWVLFWPHGLSMNMADSMEPEAMRDEQASASGSSGVAERMPSEDPVSARSSSVLDSQEYYCLLTEHLSTSQPERDQTVARYETLCDIFTDAARVVDIHGEGHGWGGVHPEPLGFTLHTQGTMEAIGPFQAHGECAEITRRLAMAGESTSRCMSYDQTRQASLQLARS